MVLCACNSYINCKLIEIVRHYFHIGHIINFNFTDDDDIITYSQFFVGQAKNMQCFFNNQDNSAKPLGHHVFLFEIILYLIFASFHPAISKRSV